MQSHYTHLHAGYLIHFSICIASRFVHFSFFLTEVTTSIYVAFLIISLCSFVITYSRSLSRIRQFAVSLPSFSVYCGRTLTCLHNILFQSYPPAHRRLWIYIGLISLFRSPAGMVRQHRRSVRSSIQPLVVDFTRPSTIICGNCCVRLWHGKSSRMHTPP